MFVWASILGDGHVVTNTCYLFRHPHERESLNSFVLAASSNQFWCEYAICSLVVGPVAIEDESSQAVQVTRGDARESADEDRPEQLSALRCPQMAFVTLDALKKAELAKRKTKMLAMIDSSTSPECVRYGF